MFFASREHSLGRQHAGWRACLVMSLSVWLAAVAACFAAAAPAQAQPFVYVTNAASFSVSSTTRWVARFRRLFRRPFP